MTTPPFDPQPCDTGGAGAAANDVEQVVLCDLDAEGNLLGTALAVYEYDPTGTPVGAPTFVDPATGLPYVVQGTLQVCPDGACLPPMQFCQTGSTTGPVEHPGRQYDLTLPINPGFAVESMIVGAVTSPANIIWEVDDHDGEAFRVALAAFMEGRLPADAVVTITNPNAGTPQVCGAALPFQIHIECLRLDQAPPDLVELLYNAGQDMVQNPAYNESPPLSPPVAQGNYGYHLLSRQDDPGPFPGNPPANDALCTSVANRGWETNDSGRTFEIWGQDVAGGVTPTPRGTPVQEITSDGPPPGGRSTIWQTFVAPSSGNFIIRVVHGGRDPGEQHKITLDNGDTNDTQAGTLINNVTNPAAVYGGNPWTVFNQTIPLVGGQTYTLAISTTNPAGGARGGLFTDMRAYFDVPGIRSTATTNDDTCVVTVDETSTTTTCSFWQPQCVGGAIAGWQNAETGDSLTNAEFWAQTPTPSCCLPAAASGGEPSSTLSNMAISDIVCATVGGIQQNAVREVVLDPSGGQLSQTFVSVDGAPIAPTTWTPGPCTTQRELADVVLCDRQTDGSTVSFLRKYVQTWSATAGAQVTDVRDFVLAGTGTYTVTGQVEVCDCTPLVLGQVCVVSDANPGVTVPATAVQACDGTMSYLNAATGDPWPGVITVVVCPAESTLFEEILCDAGNGNQPFRRVYSLTALGSVQVSDENLDTSPYVMVGPAVVCSGSIDREVVCWTQTSTGTAVHTGTIRHDDALPAPGWLLFDQNITLVPSTEPGLTFVPCGASCDPMSTTGLCLADGSPIAVVTRRDCDTGVVTQDGWINLTTGAFTAGNPPVGTIACGASQSIQVSGVFCDMTGSTVNGLVLVEYHYNPDGSIGSVRLVNATTGTTHTVVGTITTCPSNASQPEQDLEVLCDVNAGVATPFIRDYRRDSTGAVTSVSNYTLAGAAYAPTGTVSVCSGRDSESFILCDSAVTPNRFIRTYTYNAAGAVVGFTDTTLAGGAFTPTGAVGVCAQTVQSDTDFVEEVLCDSNGTAFIRLFRFNSTTGALVSTTNTTLAGAAFTPVGTVGLCSDCCPAVIGNGCSNTGSGFYTAIRATNGTISLIDSVSGAAITSGNVVACPNDNTVRTLSAEARTVTNGTPWTPGGDVVGTLTSVTATGTAGLWDMVDASGTALTGLPAGLTLTWNVEDDNILTGPVSITPQAGSTVIVSWTRR